MHTCAPPGTPRNLWYDAQFAASSLRLEQQQLALHVACRSRESCQEIFRPTVSGNGFVVA